MVVILEVPSPEGGSLVRFAASTKTHCYRGLPSSPRPAVNRAHANMLGVRRTGGTVALNALAKRELLVASPVASA
jgi:hypothetical protein